MKICILSMQRVPNFGSLLQGYSLKKMLETLGHDVRFIDIEARKEDDSLMQEGRMKFLDEREGGTTFLAKLKKIDCYALNRIYIRKKADIQERKFEEFRKEFLKLDEKDNESYYDICVIGSDEVFNCLSDSPWGFTSQLFGNVRQANIIVTYAASCGATTYGKISEAVKKRIRDSFQNMNAFSVRDSNTKSFVEMLCGKEISEHLDPVMVNDFETEMTKNPISVKLPEHYCVVYSYYNRIHEKSEIEAIKGFCESKGWKIISVGAPQMWIHNHIVLNPFEMLNVFRQAEFIITDTFHGTIFAAKYAKQFATLTRKSNENKLDDLLRRLKIEKHKITDCSQLSNATGKFLNDIGRIRIIEEMERIKSMQYLQEVCNLKEK